MQEPITTAILLSVVGTLLIISVLFSRAIERFSVPVALIFLVIGMLAGSEGIGGIEFEDYELAFRLGAVALVLILWGTEYCETHIDAHFGVYRTQVSREGVERERFRGLVPPEHSNPGRLFEDVQVRELRKWAPLRTYHGDLSNGERGNRWRLKVRLLTRHDVEDLETMQSQPFALVLTISDPAGTAPVYDEMAQLIRTTYRAENLAVRAAARVRPRT